MKKQEKYIHNVKILLERLKTRYNLKNDGELCSMLGVKQSTLSQWKSRNSLDFVMIFTKCDNLDYNEWLSGKPRASEGVILQKMEELEKRFDQVEGQLAQMNGFFRLSGQAQPLTLEEKIQRLNREIQDLQKLHREYLEKQEKKA